MRQILTARLVAKIKVFEDFPMHVQDFKSLLEAIVEFEGGYFELFVISQP